MRSICSNCLINLTVVCSFLVWLHVVELKSITCYSNSCYCINNSFLSCQDIPSVVNDKRYWHCLADALASSIWTDSTRYMTIGLQDSLSGTAPCMSTLSLPDVTTRDQISQAFLLHICIQLTIKYWRWEQPWNGLGTRLVACSLLVERARESVITFLIQPGSKELITTV